MLIAGCGASPASSSPTPSSDGAPGAAATDTSGAAASGGSGSVPGSAAAGGGTAAATGGANGGPAGTAAPSATQPPAGPGGTAPPATSRPTVRPSAAPSPSPSGAGGTTLFDDEFNGSAVDTTLWLENNNLTWLANGGDGSQNGESQCFQPAGDSEGGGYLAETVRVDSSCSGYSYTSGAVQSRKSFLYGTVEVRAKLAGGKGPWPTIWLLGAGCQPWRMSTGCHPKWPQPGSEEIDIADALYSNHTTVTEGLHASAGGVMCSPALTEDSQNWHVYSVVWGPGALTWMIDGVTTCTERDAAVPSHPMFVILDTAVGGTGGQIDNATLPQTSLFDYVRVTSAQ